MTQASWRKAASRVLESLGVFAGIFAFILFFRPTRFLSSVMPPKGPGRVLVDGFLSDVRWLFICFAAAGLAYFIRKKRENWSFRDLGFKTHPSWPRDVWRGVVAFSMANVIFLPQTIAVFPLKAKLAGASFIEEWHLVSSPFHVLVLACLFSVLSTFLSSSWEEIYWRGYFQTLFARTYAPITGFLASLLFFSLGHYFTRPEWTLLDVSGAVIGGLTFCLAFYATGSLIAAAVAHTLSNLWWDYPFFLYLSGSRRGAYTFIVGLWILTLVLCLIGRRQVSFFVAKTRDLFTSAGWRMTGLGALFGGLGLSFLWGERLLMKTGRPTTIGILLVFCVAATGLSFLLGKSDPPRKAPEHAPEPRPNG